ncbi:uncharacterized protein AMSG_09190 [Thecamonas trahens ATCC 50062]|uniref:DEP domain-containing protein n=1 Tax=Thecamonas trahens ATCC 50062 TaxID=461836 RepID=A0A0L0DL69_THETB|nr:hypothetical protein AMSG_09190 [Thecamonas trahens ATCC 50062]KNC53010.1 hypothetical protein AMSG_09190 [Thecamonas trahens ATCC 50062]|eukprot:XP_013754896.1 hypothetical protein AMSG_09190 [Thecamonas trahens ATCC 50062]
MSSKVYARPGEAKRRVTTSLRLVYEVCDLVSAFLARLSSPSASASSSPALVDHARGGGTPSQLAPATAFDVLGILMTLVDIAVSLTVSMFTCDVQSEYFAHAPASALEAMPVANPALLLARVGRQVAGKLAAAGQVRDAESLFKTMLRAAESFPDPQAMFIHVLSAAMEVGDMLLVPGAMLDPDGARTLYALVERALDDCPGMVVPPRVAEKLMASLAHIELLSYTVAPPACRAGAPLSSCARRRSSFRGQRRARPSYVASAVRYAQAVEQQAEGDAAAAYTKQLALLSNELEYVFHYTPAYDITSYEGRLHRLSAGLDYQPLADLVDDLLARAALVMAARHYEQAAQLYALAWKAALAACDRYNDSDLASGSTATYGAVCVLRASSVPGHRWTTLEVMEGYNAALRLVLDPPSLDTPPPLPRICAAPMPWEVHKAELARSRAAAADAYADIDAGELGMALSSAQLVTSTLGIMEQVTSDRVQLFTRLVDETAALMGPPPFNIGYAMLSLGSMSAAAMCHYSDVEFAMLVEPLSSNADFAATVASHVSQSYSAIRARVSDCLAAEAESVLAEPAAFPQYVGMTVADVVDALRPLRSGELAAKARSSLVAERMAAAEPAAATKVRDYFESFVALLELKIVALGETSPDPLNPRWKRGFCFDDGGNTPLAKDPPLLGTPAELAAQLRPRSEFVDDLILVGTLPDAGYLCGCPKRGPQLFAQFQTALAEVLDAPHPMLTGTVRQVYGLTLIRESVNASFQPRHFGTSPDATLNVKSSMYRMTSLWLLGLSLFYGVPRRSAPEPYMTFPQRIAGLVSRGHLSACVGRSSSKVLAFAGLIRATVQAAAGTEADSVMASWPHYMPPSECTASANTARVADREAARAAAARATLEIVPGVLARLAASDSGHEASPRGTGTRGAGIYRLSCCQTHGYHSLFQGYLIPLAGTIVEYIGRAESLGFGAVRTDDEALSGQLTRQHIAFVDTSRLVAGITKRSLANVSIPSFIMTQLSTIRGSVYALICHTPFLAFSDAPTAQVPPPPPPQVPGLFVGSEAALWIDTHMPGQQTEVVSFAQALLDAGIIRHCCHSCTKPCSAPFDSGFELYTFPPQDELDAAMERIASAHAAHAAQSAYSSVTRGKVYAEDPTLLAIRDWSTAGQHMPADLMTVAYQSDSVWPLLESRLELELEQLQQWQAALVALASTEPDDSHLQRHLLYLEAGLANLQVMYAEVLAKLARASSPEAKAEVVAKGVLAHGVLSGHRLFTPSVVAPVLAAMDSHRDSRDSAPVATPVFQANVAGNAAGSEAEAAHDSDERAKSGGQLSTSTPQQHIVCKRHAPALFGGGSGAGLFELLAFRRDASQAYNCRLMETSSVVQLVGVGHEARPLREALAECAGPLTNAGWRKSAYTEQLFMHLLLEPSVVEPENYMACASTRDRNTQLVVGTDFSGWFGACPRIPLHGRGRSRSGFALRGSESHGSVNGGKGGSSDGSGAGTAATERLALDAVSRIQRRLAELTFSCMDELQSPIDAEAQEDFMRRRPEQVLSAWLEGMIRQNIAYRETFTLPQLQSLYDGGDGILVPFVLSEAVVAQVYERYLWLQRELRQNTSGTLTHAQLLAKRFPELGQVYASVTEVSEMDALQRYEIVAKHYTHVLASDGMVLDEGQRAFLRRRGIDASAHPKMYVSTVGGCEADLGAYFAKHCTPEYGLSVLYSAYEVEEQVALAIEGMCSGSPEVFEQLDLRLQEQAVRRVPWREVKPSKLGSVLQCVTLLAPRLESLYLRRARGLDDAALETIARGCARLRLLDVSWSQGAVAPGAVLASMGALEHAVLAHVQSLQSLAGLERSGSLVSLDLRGCPSLHTLHLPSYPMDINACRFTYHGLSAVVVGDHAWHPIVFRAAVELRMHSVAEVELVALAGEAARAGSVTQLCIRNSTLCSQGSDAMAALLVNSPLLERVDMLGVGLGRKCVTKLADAIERGCPRITTLVLGGNVLAAKGASQLGRALEKHNVIEFLDVSRAKVGSSGTKLLLEPLVRAGNASLTHLDLSGNPLGNTGAGVVGRALENNALPVRMLRMAKTGMQNKGLVALASGLRHNSLVTRLSLCGNRISGAEGVRALMEAIGAGHSAMARLSLSRNKVDDAGAVVIASELHNAGALCVLELERAQVGVLGAGALARALESAPRLQRLRLANNAFTIKEVRGRGMFASDMSVRQPCEVVLASDEVVRIGLALDAGSTFVSDESSEWHSSSTLGASDDDMSSEGDSTGVFTSLDSDSWE